LLLRPLLTLLLLLRKLLRLLPLLQLLRSNISLRKKTGFGRFFFVPSL
jgi:hypothetical protein